MASEIPDMPRRDTDEATRVINDVCAEHDITQAMIVKATGLSAPYVSRMFDGQYDPNFRVLRYLYKETQDTDLARLLFGCNRLMHFPLDSAPDARSTLDVYIDAMKSVAYVGEVASRILSGGTNGGNLSRSIGVTIRRLDALRQSCDRLARENQASNKIDKVA